MSQLTQQFGKVAVLYGGISSERAVSLTSGAAVHAALLEAGVNAELVDANPDNIGMLKQQGFARVFNALHGRWGEDGVLQGVLQTMEMPFTGSGVLGCALSMDKVRSKQVWQALGLPTPSFKVINKIEQLDGLIDDLGLPLFLKPALEGSSVGVGKVNSHEDLMPAYQAAAKCGGPVLAEQFMAGSELTVGILDDEPLPVVRMQAANEFYDYQAKYESDQTQYFCPAGLSAELEQEVRDLAQTAFKALDCEHWGRVDVMLDDAGKPMLLEVNPSPGMTDHSLVPMAAKQAGLSFSDLVVQILRGTL